MNSIQIRGGTVLTMNPEREVFLGDVWLENGRISALGSSLPGEVADKTIDATDKLVLPGFVQGHTHLCQTLFRNRAEDLALLDWLQTWIWPLEASHNEETLQVSAQLGLYELLDSGVTTVLDMGTIRHTDVIFSELEKSGIRGLCGKAMMDHDADGIVPLGLREKTKESIEESLALHERWHGKADGRLSYAFAPRFALSCTQECLQEVGTLSKKLGIPVHTHAAENRVEVELVRRRTQMANIVYLDHVGLTQQHLAVAHAIHVEDEDIQILQSKPSGVLHCPGSNLKLASGIAPIPRLMRAGIAIALGSDGAACNNKLDIFREMHLAAAIQKPPLGPKALAAKHVLEMATIEGARALGLQDQIGSIEVGKFADIVILDLNQPWSTPLADYATAVVYAGEPRNVDTVICQGEILKQNGSLLRYDAAEIVAKAKIAIQHFAK